MSKDKIFTTQVFMAVTAEEYSRDLQESLEAMGRTEDFSGGFSPGERPFLIAVVDGNVLFIQNRCSAPGSVFIDHYNPDLFLALAAMTEGEEPGLGEYIIGKETYLPRQPSKTCDLIGSYTDSEHNMAGTYNRTWHRKATKEELIEYFTKTKKEKSMKTVRQEQKVTINGEEATIRKDEAYGWFLCFSKNNSNAEIFNDLGIEDRYSFVSTIVGYQTTKGTFPYVRTPEDLTKVIVELQRMVGSEPPQEYTVTREALQEIYNEVCSEWRRRIQTLLSSERAWFKTDVVVPKDLVAAAYKAASTSFQREWLKKHLPQPEKKFEPFTYQFSITSRDGLENVIERLSRLTNLESVSLSALREAAKNHLKQHDEK